MSVECILDTSVLSHIDVTHTNGTAAESGNYSDISLVFRCTSGYTSTEEDVIFRRCDQWGNWTAQLPQCHARRSPLLYTLIAVALVLILLVILLTDYIRHVRHKYRIARNSQRRMKVHGVTRPRAFHAPDKDMVQWAIYGPKHTLISDQYRYGPLIEEEGDEAEFKRQMQPKVQTEEPIYMRNLVHVDTVDAQTNPQTVTFSASTKFPQEGSTDPEPIPRTEDKPRHKGYNWKSRNIGHTDDNI